MVEFVMDMPYCDFIAGLQHLLLLFLFTVFWGFWLVYHSPSSRLQRASSKMGHQQIYWSHPHKFTQGSRSCCICSKRHGLIRKYDLLVCRQCLRLYAKHIRLIKLD